MFIEREAFR
jgi:hypothetical protein